VAVERLHAQLWIEHDILGYARLEEGAGVLRLIASGAS